MKRFLPYLLVLLLQVGVLPGESVLGQGSPAITATLSNTIIYRGESFSLSIQISDRQMVDIEMPQPDAFTGARLLSAVPSRSSNYQIVNGRTSSSVTYTYTLMATDEGSFTIPPISVVVEGTTYQTQPIPFKVVSAGAGGSGAGLPEVFLRIEPDDSTPVVGQQVIASIALYFKDGSEVVSYQPVQGWRADGFWKEELENAEQPRAETVLLENQRYRKAVLLRFALFPSRSGELTLNPYGMMIGIRSRAVSRDPFGSLFDSFGTNQRRITIESEPVKLRVRDLPSPGDGLAGDAVGTLRVTRSISRQDLQQGEGLEVITTIEGSGNLPLISRPVYGYDASFEAYTPQETTELNRVGRQISGRKVFTDILVPREAGRFEIPAERFPVFDPATGRWRIQTLPALTVSVRTAQGSQRVELGDRPGLAPLIDGTIAFHHPMTPRAWLLSDARWVFLFGVPVLIFLSAVGIELWRRHAARTSGRRLSHSAARRAVEAIRGMAKEHERMQASASSGMSDPAGLKSLYASLLSTLLTYHAERHQLPARSLAGQDMLQDLASRLGGKAPGALERAASLIGTLGRMAYSPVVNDAGVSEHLRQAEDLINELEEAL